MNTLSPISSSYVERDFTLENRIQYANNFIKHFISTSRADFEIIKKNKYMYKSLLLDKQIGSDSKYGAVYSVKYGKKPKLYIVAAKLLCVNESNNRELMILKKLTNLVLKGKTIHLPIMYFNIKIEKTEKIKNELLPDVIKYCNNFHICFNEMFAGDLKMMMNSKKQNLNFIKNTITQIFLSISTFTTYSKYMHKDAHWGNFLYHNVQKGGYFYYKVNNIDIYLENIGFIWVIWDYGFAKKIKNKKIHRDYLRIIHAFFSKSKGGWIPFYIKTDIKADNFALNIYKELKNVSYVAELNKKMEVHKILFKLCPELLVKPKDNLIINEKPFIIE
jgi:hypothetical protein